LPGVAARELGKQQRHRRLAQPVGEEGEETEQPRAHCGEQDELQRTEAAEGFEQRVHVGKSRGNGRRTEPSAPGPTLVRLDEGRVNRRAESAGFPAGSAGSRKTARLLRRGGALAVVLQARGAQTGEPVAV